MYGSFHVLFVTRSTLHNILFLSFVGLRRAFFVSNVSCQSSFCWKCVKFCSERMHGSNCTTQFSLKFLVRHGEEASRGGTVVIRFSAWDHIYFWYLKGGRLFGTGRLFLFWEKIECSKQNFKSRSFVWRNYVLKWTYFSKFFCRGD